MDKLDTMAESVAVALRGFVARSLASVTARLEVVEQRQPEKGEPGTNGRDGKDADWELIRAEVAQAVKALPPAKDGKDGRDAPPVDVEAVIKAAVERVPKPADGQNGKDGRDAPELEAIVKAVLPLVPEPTPGRDGRDGASVVGPKGEDGARGKDGRDGFTLEDFDVKLDGRTFEFAMRCGDRLITRSIKVPLPIYQGVHRTGMACEAGDTVTHSGSGWICLQDTDTPPGKGNPCWQLQIKRGNDGKNAAGTE